jgi:hypothetical protein
MNLKPINFSLAIRARLQTQVKAKFNFSHFPESRESVRLLRAVRVAFIPIPRLGLYVYNEIL